MAIGLLVPPMLFQLAYLSLFVSHITIVRMKTMQFPTFRRLFNDYFLVSMDHNSAQYNRHSIDLGKGVHGFQAPQLAIFRCFIVIGTDL